MTCIVREVTSGPSREELLNAFAHFFGGQRPMPLFKAKDWNGSEGEWRLEIIGLQMLSGDGRYMLVSGYLSHTKSDRPVNWTGGLVIEIKYDTKKRTGFMMEMR